MPYTYIVNPATDRSTRTFKNLMIFFASCQCVAAMFYFPLSLFVLPLSLGLIWVGYYGAERQNSSLLRAYAVMATLVCLLWLVFILVSLVFSSVALGDWVLQLVNDHKLELDLQTYFGFVVVAAVIVFVMFACGIVLALVFSSIILSVRISRDIERWNNQIPDVNLDELLDDCSKFQVAMAV